MRIYGTALTVGLLWVVPGLLACRACAAEPSLRAVRGVYALADEQRLPQYVLESPELAGVSLRAYWSNIEADEGEFRWVFDDNVALARAAGKKVMLRLSPGDHTPAWVYEAGARSFSFNEANRFTRASGKELRIPIPWD